MTDVVKLSKTLCFILRHKPEAIGLNVDVMGYGAIEDIVLGLAEQKTTITREDILEVVKSDDKQRFVLSEDETLIRAAQGHSFEVSTESFTRAKPPEVLFHGTADGNLESIFKNGLNPQSRHFVHLSDHLETARVVGLRYRAKGEVRIIQVDTKRMSEIGYVFYQSMNGVWLIDHVPVEFLQVLSTGL